MVGLGGGRRYTLHIGITLFIMIVRGKTLKVIKIHQEMIDFHKALQTMLFPNSRPGVWLNNELFDVRKVNTFSFNIFVNAIHACLCNE